MSAGKRRKTRKIVIEYTVKLTCDAHLYFSNKRCKAAVTVDAEHWDEYGNGGGENVEWLHLRERERWLVLCPEHAPKPMAESIYDHP